MAKRHSQTSLPQRIARTAVWMVVIPAVVIAQIVRGKSPMRSSEPASARAAARAKK